MTEQELGQNIEKTLATWRDSLYDAWAKARLKRTWHPSGEIKASGVASDITRIFRDAGWRLILDEEEIEEILSEFQVVLSEMGAYKPYEVKLVGAILKAFRHFLLKR